MAGAGPAQQTASELLAICDRRITVLGPGWSKVFHRVRTPVPTTPNTIGEHVHKKRIELGCISGNSLRFWEFGDQRSEAGKPITTSPRARLEPGLSLTSATRHTPLDPSR